MEEEELFIIEKWFLQKAKIELKDNMLTIEQIKFMEAIENLLKRYKELEEDNKELRKYYASRKEVEDLKETIACLHESSKEMFIPISVIQNKIKEIEFTSSQINGDYFMNNYKLEVLQELLEERNK